MRTLCLLLILANVLFLTWSQLIDVRVDSLDRTPVSAGANAPPIVLAREAESTRQADAAQQAAGAPEIRDIQPPSVAPVQSHEEVRTAELARADALSCTTIGPFPDLWRASQAQVALRGAGFEQRQRLAEGELWVGYWVSIQDLPSRESAVAVQRSLADNGITDVYVMPSSDPAHVLSLGVFSDYGRAQRRAAEVRALGLLPQIEDTKRTGPVYWLDVDLHEPGQLTDATLLQSGPGKIMRLEMRACPLSDSG